MAGIKFQKFLGKAPRIAAELLPDMAAQDATNVKLYSGDLIPYPSPVVADNHGLVGAVPKTLHALYEPETHAPVWMAWTSVVDVVTPASEGSAEEQRFYYTGSGKPKVSTYALATSGAQPYPSQFYDLGLPLPTQRPTVSVAGFTTKISASYARDASGIVTLVTTTPHGLKDGAFVTITGFLDVEGTYNQSGTTITVTINGHGLEAGAQVLLKFTSGDAVSNVFTVTDIVSANVFEVEASEADTTSGNVNWDITSFNASSIEVTIVNDTTLTYNSPGFKVTTTSNGDGRIDLAGDTQARTYLYTWYTRWDEESVGSKPSAEKFLKEGQVVTVDNLPTEKPAGDNQIQGIRLYRTLSTVADTEYLRLATLWFPVSVVGVDGTTVRTAEPHNLAIGDYFKISTGVSGGRVTNILDEFRFVYTGGVGSGGAGGTLYHDVSENPGVDTPRYWGDGTYAFVDDFNVTSLLNALTTDEYEPPPANLKGLTVFNNNVLVGFVDNELYFSEPGRYHAWPRSYKREIPHNIVGLATFSGRLLVITDDYPYLVDGTDPAVLALIRIDARYPCLNKRSIVNMGIGVIYATHDGLALYSTTTGPQLATRLLYNSDTWNEDLNPDTLIATAYKDSYLGWHSGGGISFERDERTGGFFVDLDVDFKPSATWYDPRSNKLYYTTGTSGDVYLWDDLTQANYPYYWESKVIVTPNPINIGAAQIDADYEPVSPVWESVATTWETTNNAWSENGGIRFRLWADNVLIADRTLDSSRVFRLPSGYLSDTFKVSVEGAVRLRSIRLAETPLGLKEV